MTRSPSQMAETLSGLGRLTELRQRLLFVVVALIIYRIGTFIPVPGVNPQATGHESLSYLSHPRSPEGT